MSTQPPVVPVVRVVTVAAVVVVALIAAVVSFAHMYGVAHSHGEDWRSWLIPVSIDGLVVAASMVLLTRHRALLPGGWLAWGALVAGVLASLGANVADAQANITARLLAGWPAVAFAVAFELLLQQRRAEQDDSGEALPEPLPAAVPEALPEVLPQSHRSLTPPPVAAAAADPAPEALPAFTATPSPEPAPEPEPLQTRLQALIDRAGRIPGRRTVATELGITEHQARALLAATPPISAALNGARA